MDDKRDTVWIQYRFLQSVSQLSQGHFYVCLF